MTQRMASSSGGSMSAARIRYKQAYRNLAPSCLPAPIFVARAAFASKVSTITTAAALRRALCTKAAEHGSVQQVRGWRQRLRAECAH